MAESTDKKEEKETNKKDEDYEILDEDSSDSSEYDVAFKVIIIGNSGVGKSCLSMRATRNVFLNDYSSTIGFEHFKFNILYKEAKIRLQIWDTCGQEIYRSLIANFYRNSSLAILVYSIDE